MKVATASGDGVVIAKKIWNSWKLVFVKRKMEVKQKMGSERKCIVFYRNARHLYSILFFVCTVHFVGLVLINMAFHRLNSWIININSNILLFQHFQNRLRLIFQKELIIFFNTFKNRLQPVHIWTYIHWWKKYGYVHVEKFVLKKTIFIFENIYYTSFKIILVY
jgi:hypothetical protein